MSTKHNSELPKVNWYFILRKCVIFLQPDVWNLPHMLVSIFCYTDMDVANGKEALIANVKRHITSHDKPPILVFPEGSSTNGKVGLLKFRCVKKYSGRLLFMNDAIMVLTFSVTGISLL